MRKRASTSRQVIWVAKVFQVLMIRIWLPRSFRLGSRWASTPSTLRSSNLKTKMWKWSQRAKRAKNPHQSKNLKSKHNNLKRAIVVCPLVNRVNLKGRIIFYLRMSQWKMKSPKKKKRSRWWSQRHEESRARLSSLLLSNRRSKPSSNPKANPPTNNSSPNQPANPNLAKNRPEVF